MVDRSRFIKHSDGDVINMYRALGSSTKVAKALGISVSTIFRVMHRNGAALDGREKYLAAVRSFSPELDESILERYNSGELSADLAREFGVTIYAIKSSLKRSGGAARPDPAPLATAADVELIEGLYNSGMSQLKISIKVGRSQSFISRVLRSVGITKKNKSGESHSFWNGGKWLTGDGYVRILISADDALAAMRDQSGYVLEHRLVMARKLGRPLLRRETVHHINGDHSDNSESNLQLRQGRHGKGAAFCCLNCGSLNIGPLPLAERIN